MCKMKRLFFTFFGLFSCNLVFAKNDVVVKSVIPVYDEESLVVVTEEDNSHSVVFNDKNQSVKYNVVIENTTGDDLKVQDIELTGKSEGFLKYTLEELSTDDVLKANETKEVVESLETIQMEGWGRNCNDELVANISYEKVVINPNTSTKELILLLGVVAFFSSAVIVVCKKSKFARYDVFILTLSTTLTITNAQESIVLPIKINVSFESQNVMMEHYCEFSERLGTWINCVGYWGNASGIKNFYISNEFSEVTDYTSKYDMTEKQNGRVKAYLVKVGTESVQVGFYKYEERDLFDLYLQAVGIIYPNENASNYFSNMSNLEAIHNLVDMYTSNVTDMSSMFCGAGYKNPNFTLDVSNFDTSKVDYL